MIAFRIKLNGKTVCTAGADDLTVLSAHITASGNLGKKTVPVPPGNTIREVHYSVGGLTSRPNSQRDVHLRWKSIAPLKIGDVVQVKVIEATKADRPKTRTKASKRRK
jgi:hypothetical protein